MQPSVDMHTHFYTSTYLRTLEEADSTQVVRRPHDGRLVVSWRGGVMLTVPQTQPSIAQRLEMMDELNVGTQVLSIPGPSVYFLDADDADRLSRDMNEEFAEICRSHPGRFGALASLVMQDTDRALDGLAYAVDELEMDGVMLLSNTCGVALDDPSNEPFWEAANERQLLVYLHPTIPDAANMEDYVLSIAVGFVGDTNLALARLAFSGVFERYPKIRWVISHLGGSIPFIIPRLDNYHRSFPHLQEKAPRQPSEYFRELLYDTGNSHRPAIRCAVESFGVDRLVFGSDFPHRPGGVELYLDNLQATGATPEQIEALSSTRGRALLDGTKV